MTPEQLAKFLREDWPHIQKRAPLLAIDVHEARKVCDALTACVGLLSQAEGVIAQAQWGPDMNRCPYCNNSRPNHMGGCWLSDTLTALATLRLVVGEKETP